MNFKCSILLLSSLFLASCSLAPDPTDRPEWIDHAQTLYPLNTYLTAVGQASKEELAGKNAIANLARIFSVEVRAKINVLTESTKTDSAVSVTFESLSALQKTIETKTEQAVSSVEITESWLSPEGEFYTLAVLEKQKLAISLRETIDEFDISTAGNIDFSMNRSPNEIASINALRKARDSQIARQISNMKLKKVSVEGVADDVSLAKIEQLINKKIATMKVSVSAPGELDKQTIKSGLTAMGMRVSDHANIHVSAFVDIGKPILINKWYWLRGNYQLSVSQNGKLISRKRWPIKILAKERELLDSRLEDKLNSKILDYIIELMSDSPTL